MAGEEKTLNYMPELQVIKPVNGSNEEDIFDDCKICLPCRRGGWHPLNTLCGLADSHRSGLISSDRKEIILLCVLARLLPALF